MSGLAINIVPLVSRPGSEPAQISAFDAFTGGGKNAGQPPSLRRVLPVERAQRPDLLVDQDTRNQTTRLAGFHAVPYAQHQRGPVKLETGQAFLARRRSGSLATDVPVESKRIFPAPMEMLVKRQKNACLYDRITARKPDAEIALDVFDDTMQSVAARFSANG